MRHKRASLAKFSAAPIPNHDSLLETNTAYRSWLSSWHSVVAIHMVRLMPKAEAVLAD
jgi:hypothetical protein